MKNIVKRSISALIYATLFISATIHSIESYTILVTLISAICLWEFNKIIRLKSIIPFLILPLSVFYQKSLLSNKTIFVLLAITIISSIRLIISLYSKKKKIINKQFDKFDLSITYIILPFLFLTQLPVINGVYNKYLTVYILLLIWSNDSFAFFFGKNFGKNKLFESVSPKKTIEGFIGGALSSLVLGGIIGCYSSLFSIFDWVFISLIISIFGTLGDLVESKFKRLANIKDSGTIMPGHGGLLDRLDSLFFLSPFVYLYIHFII